MPGQRLPMRKIRDVLRLNADGMSKRKIAISLGIGATAAGDCIRRARGAEDVNHLVTVDELQLGEGQNAVAVERRLEGEVEAGECLDRGKRPAKAAGEAG